MSDEFRTMTVQAAMVGEFRSLAASFPLGVGMWITHVYTGADVTHYISTGLAPTWVIDNLPYMDTEGVWHEGNLEQLADDINASGGTVTSEQLQSLLPYIDITNEDYPVALSRLGLSLTPPPPEPQETDGEEI